MAEQKFVCLTSDGYCFELEEEEYVSVWRVPEAAIDVIKEMAPMEQGKYAVRIGRHILDVYAENGEITVT